MAKGAAAPLKAAGKKAVVGLDGGPGAIDAIEAGEMDATVLQPAVRMARAAVEQGNAPGRGNRAIAGLSMGGVQPLAISTANPRAFEYAGIFSHAARVDSTVDARRSRSSSTWRWVWTTSSSGTRGCSWNA